MSFFVLSCDPAWGRLWPSLDCASLGNRRGRDHPRAASILRIASRAEIVKEDDSLTHERNKCGHYCKCQVAAQIVPLSVHMPISPILDDTNMVGIADSAIQFIILSFPIEQIDKMNLGVFGWFGPERRALIFKGDREADGLNRTVPPRSPGGHLR